jgi:signal transduction histidine kinase/CheY-like chemotaxis protein
MRLPAQTGAIERVAADVDSDATKALDLSPRQSPQKIDELLEELASLRAASRDRAALENLVEQLREANQNLVLATVNAQTMKDEADATNRRQTEFLAMLAHELRNPLAPISSAAQILKILEVNEPRIQQVSDILTRQVSHMTRLMDDLLDVSRVTRGLVTLDNERLDLAGIVAGAVEQVRPLMERRNHQLTLQMAAQPMPVLGDRIRLVQILANLLTNAAKYTPDGGRIVLSVDARGDTVEVRVSDNGAGIEADLLPHIFDLFIQAKRSPDRSQGGLGLGLALVKSLVAQHGGEVSAKSAGLAHGSVFTVTLPILKTAREENLSVNVASGPEACGAICVMVVDDNVDAAQTAAMLLEAHGHTVSVAFSAASALAHIASVTPDVMVIDIGLPDMDGYALCRHLRLQPQTSKSVLIALTGYGQEQDREQARIAGFDYHLVKPADHAELLALLSKVATKAKRQGSAPA